MLVTMMRPGVQLKPGTQLQPATGNWRVDPAQSYVSGADLAAGRQVQGRLPLTGRVLIAEPIENSTAWLAARAGQVSTGSHMLPAQHVGSGADLAPPGRLPRRPRRPARAHAAAAGWP